MPLMASPSVITMVTVTIDDHKWPYEQQTLMERTANMLMQSARGAQKDPRKSDFSLEADMANS